jgi:spoIIIJ-associated protein
MDVLEVSAKTAHEAIEKALMEMGVSQDEVRITILSEGKSGGIFGIGAEDARVRVERLTVEPTPASDTVNVATEILQTLLTLLEVEGVVVPAVYPDESGDQPTAPVAFNIEGDDLGILIGRRGQTLAALQYILRLIVGHKTEVWVPIIVDAEGYKERRHEALKALALRMADHVKTRGSPFTLEPMPPYERRIVHLALADNPAVYTESIGEGESRKVVIRPKRPSSGPRGNSISNNQRSTVSNQWGNSRGQPSNTPGQWGNTQNQRNNYSRPRRQPPNY